MKHKKFSVRNGDETKLHTLRVQFSAAEVAIIKRAARHRGISFGLFARTVLRLTAARVLQECPVDEIIGRYLEEEAARREEHLAESRF